jgi:hypothetical protein
MLTHTRQIQDGINSSNTKMEDSFVKRTTTSLKYQVDMILKIDKSQELERIIMSSNNGASYMLMKPNLFLPQDIAKTGDFILTDLSISALT